MLQLISGSVLKGNSPGRPSTSQDNTEHIQVAFQLSLKHSAWHISCQLQIPKSKMHDVVHKRLKLHAHKLQLVQYIHPCNKPQRVNFVTFMLEQLTADASLSNRMLHQPILVPLYTLLWMNNFLVNRSVGEGCLISPHSNLT
jgi:hypothetical protein